jgi:hypothetical protein
MFHIPVYCPMCSTRKLEEWTTGWGKEFPGLYYCENDMECGVIFNSNDNTYEWRDEEYSAKTFEKMCEMKALL